MGITSLEAPGALPESTLLLPCEAFVPTTAFPRLPGQKRPRYARIRQYFSSS